MPVADRSTRSDAKRSSLQQALDDLQQRLQPTEPTQTEDSITLRVLVQLLVIVGILSITVASAGVTSTSLLNLLAIPFSAIGAVWSWYRRHQRNVIVKFCIAIGMLLALGLFFMRLWAEPGDTRILLAELLIHLQVLHSFDLPRRKDLGYSITIGLILLGVAATISQTFTFAPLLLIFLAIALPVLVLDYRSRINLLKQGWQPLKTNLSIRRLLIMLAITLGLGLLIFAFLPRLPGYQLETYPVSSTIDFKGSFDGRGINNPGYVQEGGEGSGSGGLNSSRLEGPGVADSRFYYGFNQRVNLNLRGELKPEILMRVRSQAAGFWRVLAMDRYTGQGWEISRNDNTFKLDRSRWSYRFTVPQKSSILPTQDVVQTYTMVTDFVNLIPALYEPEHLYFPTEQIAVDAEGGLRSPLILTPGLTYTVISEVPIRDRTALGQASTDYSESIRNHYLQIPADIRDRIRQKALELLAESEQPITKPYEQALYLAQALKQQYEIQPDMPFLEADEDLVEAFLFKYNGGYPDHFSTVLTVMLRSLGIPARLVMGFAPGEFNPFTGYYVVRNTDAYAMTEVYFPQLGWFAFDPIPGHEVVPVSIEDRETFSTLQQIWSWVAGWLPSPVAGFLGAIFSTIGNILTWFIQLFSNGWVGILTGLGITTLLGLAGWLLWGLWQDWRDRRWLAKLPPMERLYQQMVRSLTHIGYPKSPIQTPLEYAQKAHTHVNTERANIIEEISQAYVQWRYGGYNPDLNHLQERLKSLRRRSSAKSKQPS
ncbi:MAG: transglutaminase TgpA family protein [Thainema sp.]